MRRKLLSEAAALIGGILYIQVFQQNRAMTAAFTAAAFAALLFTAPDKEMRREVRRRANDMTRRLVLCFLTGCLLISAAGLSENRLQSAADGSRKQFSGTVEAVEQKEKDSYQITCRIQREKVLCSYYREIEDPYGLIGAGITFDGSLQKPAAAGNPRTFDYALYLKSCGIDYTAAISRYKVTETGNSAYIRLKQHILRQRDEMMAAFSLNEDTAAVIRGILFGDTNALDEEIYETFRRNGTAHVLAVSGLHVGMLYAFYRRINKWKKHAAWTVIFVLLLLLYGTAALWSVSVRRAVCLTLMVLGADLLQRRYDLLTALGAAAALSAIQNPWVIFGAGFQMSFLAVLSMGFLIPLLQSRLKGSAAAMIAVQAGLTPYIAYTFNYVSLAGFLCNPPVIFLISLLVPVGVAVFFVFMTTSAVIPLAPQLLSGLAEMVIEINRFFSAVDILTFDVVSPPLWLIWLFYLMTVFLSSEYFRVCIRRKAFAALRKPVILICLAVSLAVCAGATPFDRAEIVFLDVGQGDSVHLRTEDGGNVLIDGGGSIRYNIGEKVLKPYLLKNGAAGIDLAAATHLHTDHYLGIVQLAEVYPVRKILTQGKAGQSIALGENQRIDILWPAEQDPEAEDENLNSLIFKVHINGITALITGDITEEGERMLIERYRGTDVLRADILKIAHHGSPYSTCDEFLEAVSPSAAVISVGKNNYGHPSEKVIEKMQKTGIIVYRTDRHGAVGIINGRGSFSICTEKT